MDQAGSIRTFTGHIVDIAGKRTYPGTIICRDGRISEIKELKEVPEGALYFLPGLTDAHVHVESSMMTPANFAKVAVTHGVVGVVSDPHEIVNVLGPEGLGFMIRNARCTRFGFCWGLPSCVPSSGLESAGAAIGIQETAEMIGREDIFYLSEMMNYPGVIARDAEVMGKIAAAKAAGKPVDGHAPGLLGENLAKYVSAGISTDHECTTLEGARQRVALGMKVIVREGSAARNFGALAPILSEATDMTMLCSDDRHPDDLMEGHIDTLVRRGTAMGISVWDMLKAAAVNPVLHYRTGSGLMRAGDKATFIAVDNLADFNVRMTVMDGHVVYDAEGGGLSENELMLSQPSAEMPNRFGAGRISEADIALNPPVTVLSSPGSAKARVIVAFDGELYTGKEEMPVTELSDSRIQKIVVYNRYGQNAPKVGYIKGFNLKNGALGSSVAHDSHNIVAVGCSDAELVKVINAIVDAKGGIAVSDGSGTAILPLPIAGIMSDREAGEISAKYRELDLKAKELGCRFHAPFITLSFMALPVIPSLKLTDMGLVDVDAFGFTEVFSM